MMEQVKIMVDEQTKLTLKQLQDALSVALAPLEKLNTFQANSGAGGTGKAEEEIRRLSRDLEDGLEGVSRKIGDVLTAQEDLFSRISALAKRQDELVQMVQALAVPKSDVPECAKKVEPKPSVKSSARVKIDAPKTKGKDKTAKATAKKSVPKKVAGKKGK